MKILLFSLLALVIVVLGLHQPSGAQAASLDQARTQALARTAFPGPMRTFHDCLGNAWTQGLDVSQSWGGCQTLAAHEVRLSQGSDAEGRFLNELKRW